MRDAVQNIDHEIVPIQHANLTLTNARMSRVEMRGYFMPC